MSSFRIASWRPHQRNTLQGFLAVTLPSGMTISDISVHKRDGERWVSLPAVPWKDEAGKQQWRPIIKFTDKRIRKAFQEKVLRVLDDHTKNGRAARE